MTETTNLGFGETLHILLPDLQHICPCRTPFVQFLTLNLTQQFSDSHELASKKKWERATVAAWVDLSGMGVKSASGGWEGL